MNWRAFYIKVAPFRIGTNQPVRITRFKFMCVQLQRFQIADSVITGAGFEIIAECQSAQRGVTAGAATVNYRAIGICAPAGPQKLRAIYAIVNIDDSPGTAQALAVGAAIAGAAAIIHVENRNPTAGPILN